MKEDIKEAGTENATDNHDIGNGQEIIERFVIFFCHATDIKDADKE